MNEIIEFILDEMRQWADECIHNVGRDVLRRDAYKFCDRLEAAWKREHGNAAAMREALGKVNRHASAIMAITTVPELYAESIKVVLHHAVEIGFVSDETLADEGGAK